MGEIQDQQICQGDTRGDRKCNHDSTHRVCAKIGNSDTSFFEFTGQQNWCGTRGNYNLAYSPHGHDVRCPLENPTWCICKWATARWIAGAGCDEGIELDCDASDICYTEAGLFFSYSDFDVNLSPAHDCARTKCSSQWQACSLLNPEHPNAEPPSSDGESADDETDSVSESLDNGDEVSQSSNGSSSSNHALPIGLVVGSVITLTLIVVSLVVYKVSRANSKRSEASFSDEGVVKEVVAATAL
jgi:hypothetical protein